MTPPEKLEHFLNTHRDVRGLDNISRAILAKLRIEGRQYMNVIVTGASVTEGTGTDLILINGLWTFEGERK